MDIETAYRLELSPNPVSETLTLKVEKNTPIEQIEIINGVGQRILVQKNINSSESRINVQSLKSGLYYLNILLPLFLYASNKMG